MTRAWRPDGSLRFDAVAELRTKYPKQLWELNWSNIYDRPDLQMRGLVLKSKENYIYYRKSTDEYNALVFGDAAYNGGIGGLDRERAACGMSATCNKNVWFGNVERFCLKDHNPLYGNRSACDINREHPYNVFLVRANKYKPYFTNQQK